MRRVLVIGAGASGLPAIKSCLDDGLEPVCIERSDDIGGLWNYKDTACDGQACVMKSTIINTSKEMMCYSDFPIPKEFPNFMHNTKVMEYFRMYADKFDLLKYIKFKTEVLQLRPSSDFRDTGKWDVEIKDLKTGETTTETFDGVLVCTGHHAEKYLPRFEGEEEFKGEKVHTHDYKDWKGYEGKRVVIIGIGNSGGDVAVELSKICNQVYLSTRRGSWVTNRIGNNGIPIDYLMNRNFIYDMRNLVPRNLVNALIENMMNNRFDHALYGLRPEHRFDSQHVMVNDELPNRIASGSIVIKHNIHRITPFGVVFEDGTAVDDIDVIIYATGYIFGFPFIDQKAFKVEKNRVNLFKYVFAPSIQPSTIAVIGCFQPLGAIMPISELQSRWAVKVFKSELPLPSAEEMWKDVAKKKMEMESRYVDTQRHTIQVDYVTFMDELAELTKCRPNLFKLLKTDLRLAYSVYFGPCTPYQFRLHGDNSWSGAREAILTSWSRVVHPFATRSVSTCKWSATDLIVLICVSVLLLALFIHWFL